VKADIVAKLFQVVLARVQIFWLPKIGVVWTGRYWTEVPVSSGWVSD